jgi:hypothetical protein
MPATLNYISVIECNFNNVVMGEGVSCLDQPTRESYAYLVGGRWWTTRTDSVYKNFNYSSLASVTLNRKNTLTVLSGTWELVTEKSVKDLAILDNTAPSSTLVLDGDAKIKQ